MLFNILYEENDTLYLLALESDWESLKKCYSKKKGRDLLLARPVRHHGDDLPINTPIEVADRRRFFESCA